MQRRSRYVLVGVIGVAGVIAMLLHRGCRPAPDEWGRTICPLSSLPLEASCEERRPVAGVPHNSIVPNSIVPNSIVPNSIVPSSIDPDSTGAGSAGSGGTGAGSSSTPPNQALLEQLADHALARDLFTAPGAAALWQDLLKGPGAPDLVRYVASCALDPGETIDLPAWPELDRLRERSSCGLSGELGLCSQTFRRWADDHDPAGAGESTWRTGAASQGCLERVSSCILARVNAVDAKVPLSMRGDGTTPVPKVPVQTELRENRGTPIQSFKRCDAMCLWGDRVRRNCDWEPRYVGQCVRDPQAGAQGAPARQVRLVIDASTPVRVRICKGIYGCDDTDPAPGAGAATAPVYSNGRRVEYPASYGGQMIAQRAVSPGEELVFDCPDNGPLQKDGSGELFRTGYYSVMVGSLEPAVPLAATVDAARAPGAGPAGEPLATYDRYPAPEPQVFSYREGAFYGMLFARSEPPAQHACASEIWREVPAEATDRFCAGGLAQTHGCFANPPGRCDPPSAEACTAPSTPGPGAKVYDTCPAAGRSWERPYTTYLNHPCDLFATDDECLPFLDGHVRKEAARRPAPVKHAGPRPVQGGQGSGRAPVRDPVRDPSRGSGRARAAD